eukprot:355096-Chlamydomonas_euryale.AAC.3
MSVEGANAVPNSLTPHAPHRSHKSPLIDQHMLWRQWPPTGHTHPASHTSASTPRTLESVRTGQWRVGREAWRPGAHRRPCDCWRAACGAAAASGRGGHPARRGVGGRAPAGGA